MPLLTGSKRLSAMGKLAAHSAVFRTVANETGCVNASRAVGIYATGLLRDGYATKGFHNKAKSRNRGPMAGFVLSDPRFTKRGDSREAMEAQRRGPFKAFKEGAGEVSRWAARASDARPHQSHQGPASAARGSAMDCHRANRAAGRSRRSIRGISPRSSSPCAAPSPSHASTQGYIRRSPSWA